VFDKPLSAVTASDIARTREPAYHRVELPCQDTHGSGPFMSLAQERRMTKHRRGKLDRLLPGMQLAIFEVVWAVFPWIGAIWLKRSDHLVQLFIKVASVPGEDEREDCDRLLGEVIEAGARYDAATFGGRHTIRYGYAVPAQEGFVELMSDRVFRAIARKRAPWRLRRGR
jgi:hypothetical protein